MSLISKFLLQVCRPAWSQITSDSIPSDRATFELSLRRQFRTLTRYLKRRAYMLVVGQSGLEVANIPDSAKTILWINQTAPSLGDALMDTAARTLLIDRRLVLVTSRKNVDLFRDDPVFAAAYTEEEFWGCSHAGMKFDLVVVDSYSPRSMGMKRRIAKATPFVGLYGYLNAYEVHRIEYSFRRIEALLGLKNGATATCLTIGPLGSSMGTERWLTERSNTKLIAIGIGGEWSFRTYGDWETVVAGIIAKSDVHILLVGSSNGIAQAEKIVRCCGSTNVRNLVGKTSLRHIGGLLRLADLYVGSDGGLWHIASACGLPSVALHADCQLYDDAGNWRSRAADSPNCLPLHASNSVNEIPADKVIDAVSQALTRLKN